jgi:hypothetical protein
LWEKALTDAIKAVFHFAERWWRGVAGIKSNRAASDETALLKSFLDY